MARSDTVFGLRSILVIIIGLNMGMYFLQSILGPWFTELFLLKGDEMLIRPYIIITSMFLHANFFHLLFNMYALFLFGTFLEQRIGARRFLITYLSCGIAAALIGGMFYDSALGASGAVFGVIGALIILLPNLRLLFFFAIPMPLWVAGIIFAAIDLYGMAGQTNVAHIAHLVGMATGIVFGVTAKKQKQRYQRHFEQKVEWDEDDVEDYFNNRGMY